MGQPRPLCLFSVFSNTNFTEKTVGVSWIRTRSRRWARWPLDHNHGPKTPLLGSLFHLFQLGNMTSMVRKKSSRRWRFLKQWFITKFDQIRNHKHLHTKIYGYGTYVSRYVLAKRGINGGRNTNINLQFLGFFFIWPVHFPRTWRSNESKWEKMSQQQKHLLVKTHFSFFVNRCIAASKDFVLVRRSNARIESFPKEWAQPGLFLFMIVV